VCASGTETEQQPDPAPAINAAVTKVKKPRAKRPAMKDQLTPWHCAECTEEMGFYQHQMVQVLRSPHEANGPCASSGGDVASRGSAGGLAVRGAASERR
jgi:hypothetical protein